jgi:hypothetical protein
VLAGVKLARDWTKQPPKLLWRKNVGEGWSGFAVVRDSALTQEQRGEHECVVCRDLHTGDDLWVHADATRYDSAMGGNGPRCTPTIDAGFVYAVGAKGLLNCIDGATGKEVWQVDILKDQREASITACARAVGAGERACLPDGKRRVVAGGVQQTRRPPCLGSGKGAGVLQFTDAGRSGGRSTDSALQFRRALIA